MHICIVTGDFPALTETFITTKVLELHKRGHRVTVIKNQHSGKVNTTHLPLVKSAKIEVLPFFDIASPKELLKAVGRNPLALLGSFSFNVNRFKSNYKAKRQAALLLKYPYDIVHFEFSGLAVSYLDTLATITGKTVVSCRGTAEKVKTISQPERAQKLKQLFSQVHAIHCVSQDMATTIHPFCSKPEKIFVNRPSIDADVFRRSKAYTNFNRPIQILSIGRFTFQKGYLPGLLAIKELTSKGVQLLWKIVGDGPQLEEIQYYIHSLGLHNAVALVGKKSRDEVLDLYNTVDIYFLPSVYEGIANVCLEAMAMELPVVATKSGGMEEVIHHNEDGLLAEVYDAADMAQQLLSIIDDFEKRKKMGVNARKKILAQFTLTRQADVFEEQYDKLLQQR